MTTPNQVSIRSIPTGVLMGLGRIIGLCTVAIGFDAGAEVITKRNGGSGYSFYIDGGAVSEDKSGWTKDAVSNGPYLVLRDDDGFDIIYSDSTGRTISSRDDGAEINLALSDGRNFARTATYPGKSIEMWVFELDDEGTGTLMLHQARVGSMFPIRKHAAPKSTCAR